ncbi:hypothetical protein PMAYCL1PPCAC_09654, partial [Pristionchus mayeri]
MHEIDVAFIAFCVYVPILIAIYIMEVWEIVKDVIYIVSSFPEFRWALYPLTNGEGMNSNVFAAIRTYLTFVCPIAHDFLNVFIAFGRLIAISISPRLSAKKITFLPISVVVSRYGSMMSV